MLIRTTNSLRNTKALALELASLLKVGDVIGLSGELGVGKSTLVAFIVEKLHGMRYSFSPTFTLINMYEKSSPHIYHIDLYRIESERNLLELGLEEFLFSNGISLIEWFPNLASYKPKEYLEITIKCNIDGSREFTFRGEGKRGAEIMKLLSYKGQSEESL